MKQMLGGRFRFGGWMGYLRVLILSKSEQERTYCGCDSRTGRTVTSQCGRFDGGPATRKYTEEITLKKGTNFQKMNESD